MKIEIHASVHEVIEFMRNHIPLNERCAVASTVAKLAPIIWDASHDDHIREFHAIEIVDPE